VAETGQRSTGSFHDAIGTTASASGVETTDNSATGSVLHHYLEDSSDRSLFQEHLAADGVDGSCRSRGANRDKVLDAVDRAFGATNQVVSLPQQSANQNIISAMCHEEMIMELDKVKGQL
jgi:hypothetical protein